MKIDPNETPEYARNIPEFESEIWLLAKKLDIRWEPLKHVMYDDILYHRIHSLGFDFISKSNVLKLFTDRLDEYNLLGGEGCKSKGYSIYSIKKCIKSLSQ